MSVAHCWDKAHLTKKRAANLRRAAIARAARRLKEQAERAAATVTPPARKAKP